MSASEDASRRKAIEFLRKFRDKRRRSGRGADKSDLRVLRDKRDSGYVWIAYPLVVVVLQWVGWYGSGWSLLALIGGLLVGGAVVWMRHRVMDHAIGLFDQSTPQGANELLSQLDHGDDFREGPRGKAIDYLKRFSERRRNFDAYSPLTDLQALRKAYRQGPPLSLFPLFTMVIFSMTAARDKVGSGWLYAAVILGLVLLVAQMMEKRKMGAALGLFEECAPKDVDELLACLESGEAGAHEKPEEEAAVDPGLRSFPG